MTRALSPFHFLLILSVVFCAGCSDEQITDPKGDDDTFHISGSDTEAQMTLMLIEAFDEEMNPVRNIEVSSEGTDKGISDLIEGKIHVANASRAMSEDEWILAEENGIDPVEVIIAYDALAIVTNLKLGVDSLSIHELREIYNGTIKNWKEVGGPDLKINLYGRKKGSGTRQYFEKNVVKGSYAPGITEYEQTQEILEAVKKDKSGIGYVGVGYIMDHSGKPSADIWATYIYSEDTEAISPYERFKVRSGNYVLCRPLYQYFNGLPDGELMDFLQFELSAHGQDLVAKYGFFGINGNHRQLNRQQGVIEISPLQSRSK